MANPSQQEIEDFLRIVADLLDSNVSVPDFSDLFAGGDQVAFERVGLATPDEIEAAVIMGLQQAEIAMQELAEEKRVAEQWSIVEGISQRNDVSSQAPLSKQLEMLGSLPLPDVPTLELAAEKAFQELLAARGGPDEAFELATAKAFESLDARDAGIEQQQLAVRNELDRRQQAVETTNELFAKADEAIPPKAKEFFETRAKTKSVARLIEALSQCKSAIEQLVPLLHEQPPAVFDNAIDSAKNLILAVESATSQVKPLVQQEVVKERKKLVELLPLKPPAVTSNDLSLFPSGELASNFEETIRSWLEQSNSLKKEYSKLTDKEFEQRHSQCLVALELAQDSATKMHLAAEHERTRRKQSIEQLRQEKDLVKRPAQLIEKTVEYVNFQDADKLCADAIITATNLQVKGSAEAFEQALQVARESIAQLEIVGQQSAQLAEDRKIITGELKSQIETRAKEVGGKVTSKLTGCPNQVIVKAFKKVLTAEANSCFKAIKGAENSDQVELFNKIAKHAEDLIESLSKLEKSPYSRPQNSVANNVEITARVDQLIQTLNGNLKIGPEAVRISGDLYDNVFKVAERYDYLAILETRYPQAIANKQILPESQKVLKNFPDYVNGKDALTKGQLTVENNKYMEAIRKIEDKIADNAEKELKKQQSEEEWQKYLISDAYKFVQLMEHPSNGNPITQLETLVNDAKATRGTITDAYRSSYDYPDRFSVEVDVLIDSRRDVVVHAHCSNSGEPLTGNACHVKLWRYRFDPGGYQLSTPLRTSLLPTSNACFQKAQGRQLV